MHWASVSRGEPSSKPQSTLREVRCKQNTMAAAARLGVPTATLPMPSETAPGTTRTDLALPLAGKAALVTGGARGIGRAIARKLAHSGCDIALNYYNSHDEAEALCAEFRTLGRRAVALKASVGLPDSVDEMFTELRTHFERLDIVVSNAASGVLKPALEMSLKHWRWCMETNAFALEPVGSASCPDDARGWPHRRLVESRLAARDAQLRLHRCLQGGA